MNVTHVDVPPAFEFSSISVHQDNWRATLLNLVQNDKPIQFHRYEMPALPPEIRIELSRRGYVDYVLRSDENWHFLTVKGEEDSPLDPVSKVQEIK